MFSTFQFLSKRYRMMNRLCIWTSLKPLPTFWEKINSWSCQNKHTENGSKQLLSWTKFCSTCCWLIANAFHVLSNTHPWLKKSWNFFRQFIKHQKGTYDNKNQNNWILKIIVENHHMKKFTWTEVAVIIFYYSLIFLVVFEREITLLSQIWSHDTLCITQCHMYCLPVTHFCLIDELMLKVYY